MDFVFGGNNCVRWSPLVGLDCNALKTRTTVSMVKKPKRRFERTDWLALGLRVLEKEGVTGLGIERICASAKKTRGSYYHHFKDQNAFSVALLDYWQKINTQSVIEMTEVIRDPREQRLELAKRVVEISSASERAIRGWAGIDERAEAVLKQVDNARVNFLRFGILALAKQMGVEISLKQADELAVIDYSLFLGAHMLKPDAPAQYYLGLASLSQQMLEAWLEKKT